MSNYDKIVNPRIGYGSYQNMVSSLLGLILIADGMEMAALSILLPLLAHEWGIPKMEQALLGSVLFFGMFLGSLLAGFVTDKLGRKWTLEYSSLATFILGILSCFISNVLLFLLVRGLFGFLIGFLVPTVPTLIVEILPLEKRGKIMALINTTFSFGQIIACILAYLILDNFREGNWRLMLFLCSITPLFVWLGTKIWMYESPRYEIVMGRVEAGVEILNKQGQFNQGDSFVKFKQEEIDALVTWAANLKLEEEKAQKNFQVLLTRKLRRITICNWLMWFSMNFNYYGLLLILPYFLSNLKDGKNALLKLTLPTMVETMTYFLIHAFVDHPKIGRKYLIVFGLGISAVTSFFSLFQDIEGITLIILFALGRFFSKMCFAVVYSYTAELYPTPIRTLGVGIASAVGRIGSFLMPFIVLKLYFINNFYPFYSFLIVGLIGSVACYCIPRDTAGTFLDHHGDDYYAIEEVNTVFEFTRIEPQRSKEMTSYK